MLTGISHANPASVRARLRRAAERVLTSGEYAPVAIENAFPSRPYGPVSQEAKRVWCRAMFGGSGCESKEHRCLLLLLTAEAYDDILEGA